MGSSKSSTEPGQISSAVSGFAWAARVHALAASFLDLRLLVLHGSRARADASPQSDWDFGYLAVGAFDTYAFLGQLTLELQTDAIDLADLARSGGLLRWRAARDGIPVFERTPGLFVDYCTAAAQFWCDAGPVIEQAYADVLDRMAVPHGS